MRLDAKRIAVQWTSHFRAAFAPITSQVQCDADGQIPRDHRKVPYTRVQRPMWLLHEQVAPVALL